MKKLCKFSYFDVLYLLLVRKQSQQPISDLTLTGTREQPISGFILTATPREVSWKTGTRPQWLLGAQSTSDLRPDDYSSESTAYIGSYPDGYSRTTYIVSYPDDYPQRIFWKMRTRLQ